MPAPKTPSKLGKKGRSLWRDVTGTYSLRFDELQVLEDACREADLIDQIEEELRKDEQELVVKGSMGQPVANPLVQELRQHRAVKARLLAALKLPDDPATRQGERSSSAREAAQARWRRGA